MLDKVHSLLNLPIMKRVYILFIVLAMLSIQSCQDNFEIQTPASRSYAQDTEVLNKFVEINKTMHEYYINPNKRSSALSYITNADAKELNAVSSLNRQIFEQSMDMVNHQSGQLSSNHVVDYVVMMTPRETYVSQTKSFSPITLKKIYPNTSSFYPKTATLKVTNSKEECRGYGDGDIEISLDLLPSSYKNAAWSFILSCEMKMVDNAKETVNVLFCGVGYSLNPRFYWSIEQAVAEWKFEVTSSSDSNNPEIARINISHQ